MGHVVGALLTPTFVGNITESPYDLVYMSEFERDFTFTKPGEKKKGSDDDEDK